MFKQTLIILVVVAGLVACEDAAQDQENVVPNQENAAAKPSLRNSLFDLAHIGTKHAKKAFDESKPLLNSIRKSIEPTEFSGKIKDAWKQVSNDEKVQKGLENLKPYMKRAGEQFEKYRPIVEDKAKSFLSAAEQKRQQLVADSEARLAALNQQPADQKMIKND